MGLQWRTVPEEVVLGFVAQAAAQAGFIDKVVLFGSRARGNARPFSDYDLAVKLDANARRQDWQAFQVNTDDVAPTLCQVSLVEWTDTLRPELAENIAKAGVVIYER